MASAAGGESLIMIAVPPLLAAVVTGLAGPRWLGCRSHWPALVAFGYSFLMAITLLLGLHEGTAVQRTYDWLHAGHLHVSLTLMADTLSAVMLCTVMLIGFLVALFSIGYMQGDPGYPRYYAVLCLFVFCMVMLVMASSFLMLFIFWEGVGLCSYLLIGYWFERPAAAAAAKKAFLVNRIGDFGLLVAIFLIWSTFGSLGFLDVFGTIESAAPATKAGWPMGLICFLLMLGAMGKSAQFPLHVWLPDAMEGPTPASALIHAATMVTAGVYLVARCTPLFLLAPGVQVYVAVVGGITALLAALIALTQTDLKRVMAYSTVSQLGYMFLALGAAAAGPTAAAFAATAAIFHLFTHAFFKALLFMASGSVMHAMGGVIDMRRFGGLRKLLPWTHLTFAIGAAGLAGLPPLAGFWSKDEILVALHHAGSGSRYAMVFTLLYLLALATAFLTAFYTARAYFLTFWGEEKVPEEAGHHAHEAGWTMLVPLFVLAAGTVAVGYVFGPMTHAFAHSLSHSVSFPQGEEIHAATGVMLQSIAVAGAGVLLAAVFYLARPEWPKLLARRFALAYDLSRHKFYLDELYDLLLIRPLWGLAQLWKLLDQHVIDGLVDLAGKLPGLVGQLFRPVQNGLVQFYALASLLGLAVFLLALLIRYT